MPSPGLKQTQLVLGSSKGPFFGFSNPYPLPHRRDFQIRKGVKPQRGQSFDPPGQMCPSQLSLVFS